MENLYCIGVANRYALFLNEEEDILEVLKVQEQEKEAKKRAKLVVKETKKTSETKGKSPHVSKKGAKEVENLKQADLGKIEEENLKPKISPRPAQEKSERNVTFAVETREYKNSTRNPEDGPYIYSGQFSRFDRDRQNGNDVRGRLRGTGRLRGRFRGNRGGAGGYFARESYDNRLKREFDRQSGSDKTGVKPIYKREGGGAYNWGNHRDEINEQMNSTYIQEESLEWLGDRADGDAPPTLEVPEEKEADVTGEVENENVQINEEEPRELTLDEYYAMRGNRQKPTYNLRKAGEGEDMTQWKKMYVLRKKKDEDDDDDDDDDDVYDVLEYPQRVGRQKYLLDIDIRFTDSRRGARGRGRGVLQREGRWGPSFRGTGEERSPATTPPVYGERFDRGDREIHQNRGQKQNTPRVDDEHDFPSLG